MKKLLMFLVMVVMAFVAIAQTPQISYQAVVRDAQNRLVTNTTVQVTVEVLDASDATIYTQGPSDVITNNNGLMSMMVGDNTPAFANINWANAKIKTTVTINGADVVNTVPVTAVPLALRAQTVDPSSLTGYATIVYVQDTLAYYYTKTETDNLLADYATVAKVLQDSTALAGQITGLGTAIDNRIKADSLEVLGLYTQAMLKLKTDSIAFINAIHDTAEVLRHEPTERSKKYIATESQTEFTLTSTPKANYLVRMYINGIMVGDNVSGDNDTPVLTVDYDAHKVTYNPAANGGKILTDPNRPTGMPADTVIISWFE